MELVIIESPWKADSTTEQIRNKAYALRCLKDSISRGEAPYASHLLYTQVLNEFDEKERSLGIEIGLTWGNFATKTVVYQDYGITTGMNTGISRAIKEGRIVECRSIGYAAEINSLLTLLQSISVFFDVLLSDLTTRNRKDKNVIARMVFFKVARILFPKISITKVGKIVNRDHATVLHGIWQVDLKHHLTTEYLRFCEHNNITLEQCPSDHSV